MTTATVNDSDSWKIKLLSFFFRAPEPTRERFTLTISPGCPLFTSPTNMKMLNYAVGRPTSRRMRIVVEVYRGAFCPMPVALKAMRFPPHRKRKRR